MKLTVLGSSSSGNGYILHNEQEALLLECGVPFSKVQEALDFRVETIVGCLVSHEHGDHYKHVGQYLKFVSVFASAGTIASKRSYKGLHRPTAVEALKTMTLGRFKVKPFDVVHDCAQPFGYLIQHPEIGLLVFATDTRYLKHHFRGLTNMMVECNWERGLLDRNVLNGTIPAFVASRTRHTHMGLDTCLEMFKANDLSKVNNIVLLHLSSANSDAALFQSKVEKATGKSVHVAKKGLEITLNNTPF